MEDTVAIFLGKDLYAFYDGKTGEEIYCYVFKSNKAAIEKGRELVLERGKHVIVAKLIANVVPVSKKGIVA